MAAGCAIYEGIFCIQAWNGLLRLILPMMRPIYTFWRKNQTQKHFPLTATGLSLDKNCDACNNVNLLSFYHSKFGEKFSHRVNTDKSYAKVRRNYPH